MKRCLVFGGSGALGRAVCEALAARGARVALTYRTNEKAAIELVARLPQGVALPLDVTSVADVERTIEDVAGKLGGIDAFVQCAGIGGGGSAEKRVRVADVDEPGFDRLMAVNVKSTFFATRKLADVFARQKTGGEVVLIGSVDVAKPVPSPVHYAASKGALLGMAQALAKELGELNVRVNLVAPGILDGGLSKALPAELHKEYLKHAGLKRYGKMSEVAATVAWLATENTYVTGQTIVLDGGL